MSWSLILGCLWVVGATITALLPYRRQFPPGIALLIAAPVLIGLIWVEHGWMFGVPAVLGFVSMFRRPFIYWGRKYLGLPVETRPIEDRAHDETDT